MSVRIIAGRSRGLALRVPDGHVRPTTDRVREALFNVLAHRVLGGFAGIRVLDLFAGAGSLGLEAASRGAASVRLVESNAQVARVLAQNVARMGKGITLTQASVEATLRGAVDAPYDLVFLDPPYGVGRVAPTLAALVDGGWLTASALVCVEHPADESVTAPIGLEVVFSRRYGTTGITLLELED
jgi:16S rRNA (guanine966-N2)-methyltransferase